MQRINFTETTLTTLKRNANCSFANAVYKLGIKAQQGLKCDDLFKKSVLMNEVNKLLCKYKLDECISFHPALDGEISSWYFGIGNFTGTITYNVLVDGVSTYIGEGTTVSEIVTSINNNTEGTGFSAVLGTGGYFTIYSPVGCFVKADLVGSKDPSGTIPATTITFLKGKCPQEETCVDYTEEELNCITPQDLQVLYEFTHKYKETLAKSSKKITNPTSSTSSDSSDCCNWGSIGGSIGNQSDLVAYLQTIEKNFISAYDESALLSSDIKSLKFLGAGVTATNSSGDISITIPGGGSGGSVAWGAITGTLTAQTDLTSYLASNYYPLSGNPSGFLTNISATNGLTESPTNTIKLGGTLTEDTTITSSTFLTTITGTPALKTESLLNLITTSGLGGALKITADKNGIDLSSGTIGLSIISSTAPILARGSQASALIKTGTTDSTIDTILSLGRSNTGNVPSLINSGVAISFSPGNDSGGGAPSDSLLSLLYEDPTNATVQTKFRFSPLGLGTTTFGSTLETFGSGKLKLNAYGLNTFSGTPTYLLGVDATGNVVETSVGGGGATDLGYTASPTNGIVTSSTGTDATLTLATGTNAGLLAPADFTKLGNQSGTNTGDNAANSLYSGLASSKQDISVEVTGNITAVLNTEYINTANATYTDPTPAQGKGYSVLVVNGTATIGGVAYATSGTLIYRTYHSGAWVNSIMFDEIITIDHQFTLSNLADATPYFFDQFPQFVVQAAASKKTQMPYDYTLVAANIQMLTIGTLGTSENSTLAIRVNNTTDSQVSNTIKFNALNTHQFASGLNIDVLATDYFESKLTTATFATNPTQVASAVTYYLRRKR